MSEKKAIHFKIDGQLERTPQGFLKVPVLATKVGVFKYMRNGKVVRELRPPEEVFSEDSLVTLRNAPLTNEHPKEGDGFVRPENVKRLMVGFTADNVENLENVYAKTYAIIADAATIAEVENGKREVSCGYACEHDYTPGVWNNEPYDLIQRNIRYNHLAVTKKGRQGPDVALKMDSFELTDDEVQKLTEEKTMKVTILGKEYEVADDVAAAINQALSDKAGEVDATKKELDAFGAKLEEANAAKDQAVAKADSLAAELEKVKAEKKADSAQADVKALVAERRKIEKVADSLSVKEYEAMENQELKVAVIKADSKDFDSKDKSEAYINARFDIVAEKHIKADSKAADLGAGLNKTEEQKKADSQSAREASMARAKEMSKQPLSATKK